MQYHKVLSRLYNQPYLLRPEKLEAIRQAMLRVSGGIAADGALLAELRAARDREQATTVNRSVAVLPIVGTLAKRMSMVYDSSGFASTDRIGLEFDRLVADDSVGAILLDVDSPGGETFGIAELADKIFNARGKKPIEAIANAEAASGAFWIATAADRLSVTPSGWAGSVGVYLVHTDLSAMNEQVGVKVTYVSAGQYKIEGNPDAPLSDDTRAYYQQQVDAIYGQFVAAVARNRGVPEKRVQERYGQGRMLLAADAKAAGMVDRIETLDEAIARLSGAKPTRGRGGRAALERERLALERFR